MDPNERLPGTRIFEDLSKLPPGIDVPEGVDRKNPQGWYVQGYTTRDGRTFYEFYQRGHAAGRRPGEPDPVIATVEGPVNTEQADRYTKAVTRAEAAAPEARTPAQQNEAILNQQRAKNAALPPDQDPRYETDQERAQRADARIKEQGAAAEAAVPQVVPGTLNTTSPNYATLGPDGGLTWQPNPNYRNPSPRPLAIPNARTIIWDNGDGTTRTEKNPNYVKPSKIQPHPSDPRRMINVTEDDDGNPVILPVDDRTVIKPADLPVLQARFGEVAQGLGALAQELNGRVARGEMTPEERQQAFTAAHQQAQTQVSEINSILEHSRTAWAQGIQQRGQTLSETASRRSYAADVLRGAVSTGDAIARSAGPGHGRAIAGGVGALLGIGRRYAEGMGGFRESPELPMPASLQQVQGIGIPGYPAVGPPRESAPRDSAWGPVSAASGASGGVTMPPMAPSPSGPAQAPRPWTDVATGPSILPWTGGATPAASTLPDRGASGGPTLMGRMGAALGAASPYAGLPVAAGGPGVFDPLAEAEGMLAGREDDPDWAEAVRRAAASADRGGYRRFFA